MEDMLDIANEVQETLGRTYGMPDDVDEADLEAGWYKIHVHTIIQCTGTQCHMEETFRVNSG